MDILHKRYEQPRIELCRQCEGRGEVQQYPPNDILQMEEPEIVTCPLCLGSGRVVRSSETTIKILPYR